MHGYICCGSQRKRTARVGGHVGWWLWVEKRGTRVRLPARGVFAVVLHCMEAWSWELQRPHLRAEAWGQRRPQLRAGGGAVSSSPLP
eukprot:2286543-Prymnesium_polylepis.1